MGTILCLCVDVRGAHGGHHLCLLADVCYFVPEIAERIPSEDLSDGKHHRPGESARRVELEYEALRQLRHAGDARSLSSGQ